MTISIEQMVRTKERMIPRISLHDFDDRKDEIANEILDAAENSGFFVLENQASPSVPEIEKMFQIT